MGTLSELTISTRKARALEVVRLMTTEGLTQEQACQQAGITPETFRRYRDEDPEGLQFFQELLAQTTRNALAMVLSNRGTILQRLIDDALAETTKPGERVAIFRAMEKHLRELAEEARLNSGDAGAAEDVLGGPSLSPAQSRFSISQEGSTTTIKIDTPTQIIQLPALDRSDIRAGSSE